MKRVLPALCSAAGHIGSVQIRNRATIGGPDMPIEVLAIAVKLILGVLG